MLHIHQLNHFGIKAAELESVYLIRELKNKTPYPLSTQSFENYFSELFLSPTDQEHMEKGLILLEPTMEKVRQILAQQDSAHEPINLQRALQVLKEMPQPLQNNISYIQEIIGWQAPFIPQATSLFNNLPKFRTHEERVVGNQQINILFQKVLRGKDFLFNYSDIVGEAHLAHINSLSESMKKGFLFHVSLEDELKRLSFDAIKAKLPKEKVEEMERIAENVEVIRKAVDRAYSSNMRMVNWAIVLYAYVKWLSSSN